MSKILLVTGATGQQGGAVVEALLADPKGPSDFSIIAVTRDPNSASAKKLAGKSAAISLLKGDLNDVPAIFKSASEITKEPIWGVFSVQVPNDVEVEEQQGKALVDESLKQSVKHFVYTSVDRGGNEKSWDNPTNVPHFSSKHRIEQHLHDSTAKQGGDAMSWTILRPVAFMDNIAPGFALKVFMAAWRQSLGTKPLQMIAVSDIGYFGAQAFLHPEKYSGKAIGLAGDNTSIEGLNKAFLKKLGTPLPETYGFFGSALLWGVEELGTTMKWSKEEGYGVDIEALRKIHPGLLNFEDWMEKKSMFETK